MPLPLDPSKGSNILCYFFGCVLLLQRSKTNYSPAGNNHKTEFIIAVVLLAFFPFQDVENISIAWHEVDWLLWSACWAHDSAILLETL